MAITLNCAIYGDQQAFGRIFQVNVLPDVIIGEVKKSVLAQISWRGGAAMELLLYTPSTPISIATEETFREEFARLDLKELLELNPVFSVSESGLSQPGVKQLHIVVVVPAGE
jgi:hypothetical protein